MRKGDWLWAAVLVSIVAGLFLPSTRDGFASLTRTHPYLMGFMKVAILATMGELLAGRINAGDWVKPAPGLHLRTIVWGLLGMSFALTFAVFGAGTKAAIADGFLPAAPGVFARILPALLTSTIMNLCFAPVMMAAHRITDTYIELAHGRLADLPKFRLAYVAGRIDWPGFIAFVVAKTIPLFWIPAHTVTFMLPAEYRVLMAAMLSIALGAILAFARQKKPAEALAT
ncbi:MAG TPA: hypothetical protein VGK74_15460 [Symbiobacteriaceae bacterium]